LLSVASQLQSSSLKLTVSRFRLSCHSAIVKVLPIRKPMPALPSIGPGNLIFSDQSCPLGILFLCNLQYITVLCFCQASAASFFRAAWAVPDTGQDSTTARFLVKRELSPP